MTDRPKLKWSETRALMRADRKRLTLLLEEAGVARSRCWLLHPCRLCTILHRLSHHAHRRRGSLVARALWHLNLLLTGADISEPNEIGPGLVVLSPVGVALMCSAGKNLTVHPHAGVGGEIGRREDIGAGPGLPVLGDDVTLCVNAGILGPVRIGDGVVVRPGAIVMRDVPAGAEVEAAPARVVPVRAEPAPGETPT